MIADFDAKPTRPLMRYHGGKWKMAEWIIGHFPAHRIYVEPFGGGGSVLLNKPRSRIEVYNDLDEEIVNVFRVMRDDPDELIRAIELTPFSRVEHQESFRPAQDPVERARRTIVRSYMSYGSSFTRTKRDGSCQQSGFRAVRRDRASVAVDWTGLPAAFQILALRLRGVLVECREACGLMEVHDEVDALHYVDPPYVHSTRTLKAHGHHAGYRHEMDDAAHRRLAKTLHRLRGTVILSGYPCALYDRELYPKWRRVERGSFTLGARPRVEVLWIKEAKS